MNRADVDCDNENSYTNIYRHDSIKCKDKQGSRSPGICGRALHFYANQLEGIFQHLFWHCLNSLSIPAAWKLPIIVQVPRKTVDDYRPVALTSLVMKVLKEIIKALILKATKKCLDPLQFAYQTKKVLMMPSCLSSILSANTQRNHNPTQSSFCRFLKGFEDYSTISPWYLLVGRQQRIHVNGTSSDSITTYTGSPKGCFIPAFVYFV